MDLASIEYEHTHRCMAALMEFSIGLWKSGNSALRGSGKAVKSQWLNGKHVVFGVVVDGEDVVKRIEALGTNGGKPKRKITIVDSGVVELIAKEQNERIPVALSEPFVLRKIEKESS